ncbi:MAG: S-ribosylhomocysteine lyase [Ruminococcaceae bacterium]|nr:S-ribosylhomocysteine lyase [Oscillospiraceae bacterium]
METITSFRVDHDKIGKGIYISRIDGDIVTYDLRTRIPNGGDYMDHVTMHSVEHMFATYIRNSAIGEHVIYFGPMGCRTGFYLLVRSLPKEVVLDEVMLALERIVGHTDGMFGATRKECGNYRELSLDAAKTEAAAYLAVLRQNENTFEYPN